MPGLAKKLAELQPVHEEYSSTRERNRAFQTAARSFEEFVIELLRAYVRAQSEAPHTHRALVSQDLGYDLVVPVPVMDLKPRIAVEIKYGTEKQARAQLWNRVLRQVAEMADRIRTLLVVSPVNPSSSAKRKLQRNARELAPEAEVHWWGPAQLEELIQSLGDEGRNIVETMSFASLGAALRRVGTEHRDAWKDDRADLIQSLKASWLEDRLVLFLGAGVSIDAGVPSWNRMLSLLYTRLIGLVRPDVATSDDESARAVRRLLELQDDSPLLAARALRSGLGDQFEEAVRKTLYANCAPGSSLQPQELARLCDPLRGHLGVRAVVTYNFDDLLEQQLAKLNVDHRAICTARDRPHPTELAIYHVHGLIPESGDIDSEQVLVFSEEGYHLTYNNPYNWSNVVQLNLLTQHTCLFVGLSLTDPNLRRLLEIASTSQGGTPHVALLRRGRFGAKVDACPKHETDCPLSQDQTTTVGVVDEAVLAIHHEAWESTLRELGVRVLWFEDFSEIAGILAPIRAGPVS